MPFESSAAGNGFGSSLGLPEAAPDPTVFGLAQRIASAFSGTPAQPSGPAATARPDTSKMPDMSQWNEGYFSEPPADGEEPAPYGISASKPLKHPEVKLAEQRAALQQQTRDNAMRSRARLLSALSDEERTLQEIQTRQPSNRELIALRRMANPQDLFSPLHSVSENIKPLQDKVNSGEHMTSRERRLYARLSQSLSQSEEANRALANVAGVNARLKEVSARKQDTLDEAEGIANLPPGPTPQEAGQAAQQKINERIQKKLEAEMKKQKADVAGRKKEATTRADRETAAAGSLEEDSQKKVKGLTKKYEDWELENPDATEDEIYKKKKALGLIDAELHADVYGRVKNLGLKDKLAGKSGKISLKDGEKKQLADYKKANPHIDAAVIEEEFRKFKGLE